MYCLSVAYEKFQEENEKKIDQEIGEESRNIYVIVLEWSK